MKKFFGYITMAVLALTTLTSCDKDVLEAYTLQGQWAGYIDAYYRNRWGMVGSNYETVIYFNRTHSTRGDGYEVDYDLNDPRGSFYYSTILWEVRNGVIYIDYPEDRYADGSIYGVNIYEYHLDDYYFNGYMDERRGSYKNIRFSLRYRGNFDWEYYRSHSGTWRRGATTDEDVVIGEHSFAKGAFAKVLKERSKQVK